MDTDNKKMCKCCRLYKSRKNMVWHRGTSHTNVDVLFIGDAPGKEDDLQGKPFTGLPGKILDDWINRAEISSYGVINLLKCRIPNNRPPTITEIRSCLPHFIGQMYELNPKIIVSLGRTACATLLDIKELTRNIGKAFQSKYGKVVVFPHPSLVNKRHNVYIPITELKEMVEQCQSV
jgi:uracil-DNA glycosylase family 4